MTSSVAMAQRCGPTEQSTVDTIKMGKRRDRARSNSQMGVCIKGTFTLMRSTALGSIRGPTSTTAGSGTRIRCMARASSPGTTARSIWETS